MKWNGTQTDFIEVIKALLEAGLLQGEVKHTAQELGAFLGVEVAKPYQLLKFIKKRKKSTFVALERMQKALNHWKETTDHRNQRNQKIRNFDRL